MSDKTSGRWFIKIVLVLGLVSFLGFSIFPYLSAIQANPSSSGTSPTPAQTETSSKKLEELKAQEKGYELVLQREPENQTALKGLLQVRLELVQLGQTEVKGTIEPLEKLAKLNPDQPRYNILLAQAKQYMGDREGAAKAYRTILGTNAGNLDALQGLVQLLMEEKRPEAAIGLLQDTLKNAPAANQTKAGTIDTSSVQLLLGAVYADQRRYDEAIAIYDGLTKNNAKDWRPIFAKAMVFKLQGKNDEAKPLFTAAIDLAPPQFKDRIKEQSNNPIDSKTPPSNSTPNPSNSGEKDTKPTPEKDTKSTPEKDTKSTPETPNSTPKP